MPVVVIEDPADPRLADYRSLTDVALRSRVEPERGLFMAESAEVIRRAAAAGITARSLLMSERWLAPMEAELRALAAGPYGDVPVFLAPPALLEAIAGFHVHRGAIAAMARPALPGVQSLLATLPGNATLVVLEDLVDHTNVGAIFRAAAGLGADAVLVSEACADPLYRRSVRVSMGTVFQVPWTRLGPLEAGLELLRTQGFQVAAVDPGLQSLDLSEFVRPDRLALLLGAEGGGLSTRAKDLAEVSVRIPMSAGVDSLNVSAAAAVVLYALLTSRPGGR